MSSTVITFHIHEDRTRVERLRRRAYNPFDRDGLFFDLKPLLVEDNFVLIVSARSAQHLW
jgi:hypothetical protein